MELFIKRLIYIIIAVIICVFLFALWFYWGVSSRTSLSSHVSIDERRDSQDNKIAYTNNHNSFLPREEKRRIKILLLQP